MAAIELQSEDHSSDRDLGIRPGRDATWVDRRLHPLSWLFATANFAKGFIVPAILVLFASGGVNYELWASVLIVPLAVRAVAHCIVFRYGFADDEMVVCEGVLTKTERHIPYARIQNIDLVQNPFHRLLKVALVRVETASGGKPEAVIRVLSLEAVEEMRGRVFVARAEAGDVAYVARESTEAPSDPTAVAPRRTLLETPALELVKLGVISNKGLVVVGAAVGLLWQQDGWWELDWTDGAERWTGSARAWLETAWGSPVLVMAFIGLTILLVAAFLLRVFSIGWFLFQLHGFTLTRRRNDLRVEYGLFNRVSRTIPRPRIQMLKTIESPLHRLFDRQSVELRTVGGGSEEVDFEDGGPKTEGRWLAPMIPTSRVPQLLREVLPQVNLEEVRWEPIARRAWRRVFKRWVALVTVLAVVGAVFLDPWAMALGAAAAVLAYVHSRLYVKHAGYALTTWGLVLKSGWWERTTKIVRYDKIQTVGREESPFDRRNRMASVLVDVAGAEKIGYTIVIPYLETLVAADISRRLYKESSRRAFRL